jgi:hypothetical protein
VPIRNLAFQPSQRSADTGVDATTERQMVIGVSGDVEPVPIRESARITVGGGQREDDDATGRDHDTPRETSSVANRGEVRAVGPS